MAGRAGLSKAFCDPTVIPGGRNYNDLPRPGFRRVGIGIKRLGIGGARRDRTADLNTASVALSQLSYGPT
jgi:hypothetical protein